MTIQELVAEASAFDVGLSAEDCLKCNVCNTVCPVARVTDRFPGPKYVGPQAQRFRLATLLPQGTAVARVATPDVTVDWCSGCGLCTTACPADVQIAEMNNRARNGRSRSDQLAIGAVATPSRPTRSVWPNSQSRSRGR